MAQELPPEVTDPAQCWETLNGADGAPASPLSPPSCPHSFFSPIYTFPLTLPHLGTYFYCEATRRTQFEVPPPPAYIIPLGWQVHTSNGLPFFFHEGRGETSWDLPRGYVALPEPPDIVNDLSVYWETHLDAQGQRYYYQEASGVTQSELPTAPVPPRGASVLRGKLPVALPPCWYAAVAAATGEVYFVRDDPSGATPAATDWDLPVGSVTGSGASGGGGGGGGGGGAGKASATSAAAAAAALPHHAPPLPVGKRERAQALARFAVVAWIARRRRGMVARIQHRPRLFRCRGESSYLLINPLGDTEVLRKMRLDRQYEPLGVLTPTDTAKFGFTEANAAAEKMGKMGAFGPLPMTPTRGKRTILILQMGTPRGGGR